jgi:hypothetical protein
LSNFDLRLNGRVVRLPVRSGVGAARGTVLVFLGDDCLATPDWLARHLLAQLREDCVVLGDTRLRVVTHLFSQLDGTEESPNAQAIISPVDLDDPELLARRTYAGGSDYRELAGAPNLWMALTARDFSARRERLEAAGGWAPDIETPSVLETDVAMRLRDGGARFGYEARAMALRQDHSRESISIARSIPLLL